MDEKCEAAKKSSFKLFTGSKVLFKFSVLFSRFLFRPHDPREGIFMKIEKLCVQKVRMEKEGKI